MFYTAPIYGQEAQMSESRSSHSLLPESLSNTWRKLAGGAGFNRGAAWGLMIVGALVAFEIFNFSTTEYALHDLLGALSFVGLPWATVLAIAFCSIDFAGIARIFTPGEAAEGAGEVWYLFGAWLLAACFNAALTWWGVSIAILSQASSGAASLIGGKTMTTAVPVFVAAMVWLIRVLIIGTFSASGDRLFSSAVGDPGSPRRRHVPVPALHRGEQADLGA
jgi:hypothetical protein